MGQTINYPDGSSLTSSALTLAQINAILQPLTLGMLGQEVVSTSSFVRIQWPTQGAPFQDISDDVCYLACALKGDPYDRIRDRYNWPTYGYGDGGYGAEPYGGTGSPTTLTEQWNYTRAWSIKWCFYGPNSTDYARALRSGLYQDYFTNLLANSQLFPVSDFPEAVRAPEQINGQWIERVDFSAEMYEFVTENICRPTVASVEVIVENAEGLIADITVS